MRNKIASTKNEIKKGIKLWNKENPEFKIRDSLIEQNIFSPFTDINVVCINFYMNNKISAFAIIKYLDKGIKNYVDKNKGWISLLTVDPNCADRKKVIVNSLKIIEEFLIMHGVKKIRFGGDPQNFLAGLPSSSWNDYLGIFKEMGYKKGVIEFDLKRNIEKFDFERNIKEEKLLSIQRVYKTNENKLYNFFKENFPGRWLYEAKNIGRIPGGLRDYWFLEYENKVVGFARTNTINSTYKGPNINWVKDLGEKYCGLGPLGIKNDYRNKGWGLYLIAEIIKELKKEGYKEMVIDWTTLVDYYKKLGFEPYKKYLTLEKKV
ncbi:MAG: GNAT family N-acetyltransferase [Bacillota bacterium]